MKNTNRNRNLKGGMKNAVAFALAIGVSMSLPITAMAETYDISNGSITVDAREDGYRYVTQDNGVNNYQEQQETVIMGSTTENNLTIKAATGQTAEVTLNGVNIQPNSSRVALGKAAVQTLGEGNVSIELNETNILKGESSHAGLEKGNSGTLSVNDEKDAVGTLEAQGGYNGAGIGGGYYNQNVSNIEINGGTINATGGYGGAGIGGASNGVLPGNEPIGSGSNITINGGNVTATGGENAAGIGGGYYGSGTEITISGGVVNATGGNSGAGIGGGYKEKGEAITISGGTVTATGGVGGAGIGGGDAGAASKVVIRGDAQVTAQGGAGYSGRSGAAIGNGYLPSQESGSELDVDTTGLYTTGSVKRLDGNGSHKGDVIIGTVTPPVQPEEPPEEPETPPQEEPAPVPGTPGQPEEPTGEPETPSQEEPAAVPETPAPAEEPAAEPETLPQEEPTPAPETPTQPEDVQILDPAEESEVVPVTVTENVQNVSTVSLPEEESPAVSAPVPSAEHHEVRIASAVNGAVAVDRENAKPGETVIVMVTPFEGYILKGISVIRDDGQPVPVTEFGNGVFTFVMPEGHVTIHAEFVPAG